MNIRTAALYAKQGLKVRRSSWEWGEIWLGKKYPNNFVYWANEDESDIRYFEFGVGDLVADDWELIRE